MKKERKQRMVAILEAWLKKRTDLGLILECYFDVRRGLTFYWLGKLVEPARFVTIWGRPFCVRAPKTDDFILVKDYNPDGVVLEDVIALPEHMRDLAEHFAEAGIDTKTQPFVNGYLCEQ